MAGRAWHRALQQMLTNAGSDTFSPSSCIFYGSEIRWPIDASEMKPVMLLPMSGERSPLHPNEPKIQ
jgi:hypothetical protein